MKSFLFGLLVFAGVSLALVKHTSLLNSLNFTNSSASQNIKVSTTAVPGDVVSDRMNDITRSGGKNIEKNVMKVTVDQSRVLYLLGVVDFPNMQILSNEIKRLSAKSNDPIWLLIDSPGGSVLDGATLISQIEASSAPVYTVCTRLCASMAAMIHSYGAKKYSTDRSILMYHPASGGAQGQVNNMLSQLTTLTRYLDKMVANVIGRSSLSKDEYDKLVPFELWIDSDDSVTKGLSEAVINLNVPYVPEQMLRGINLGEVVKRRHASGQDRFDYISPHIEFWDHQ